MALSLTPKREGIRARAWSRSESSEMNRSRRSTVRGCSQGFIGIVSERVGRDVNIGVGGRSKVQVG